jgi:hypothetical protein
MDMVNQYYPKLDLDNFHYGVLIPALNEISNETRDKGAAVRDRVIDTWNTLIQAKDYIVDVVNKLADIAGDVITINTWLSQMLTELQGVKTATQDTADDIANFNVAGVQTAVTTMSTNLGNALGAVQGAVTGLASSFNTSLQNELRIVSGNLTTVANNITSTDPRNSINTGFTNLQNALSGIPSSLSTMSTQPRNNNTYQYITINGFAVNQSLAAVLRSYGVPI